jgi:hypothetical protein
MDLEDVRLAVYESFARQGTPPDPADLVRQFEVSREDIRDALGQLATARHVVLDDDGSIVMAHPFSAIPLGFSVMGASTLWWGGCAWDSFAMPHLLHRESSLLVATTCPGCSRAHAWNLTRTAPPEGGEVAHFLIPAARMWDDVVCTCSHQRIFCSEGCVDDWLARTENDRGYVMDLATLWRFASDWYTGRLERGYTRREPAQAADYLRTVGLSGAFWGVS